MTRPPGKVHLNGAYQVTKAAWPYMRDQEYGRVLTVSSPAGLYGNIGQANYGESTTVLLLRCLSLPCLVLLRCLSLPCLGLLRCLCCSCLEVPGDVAPQRGPLFTAMAKSGLNGLMQTLAKEGGRRNIQANSIAPLAVSVQQLFHLLCLSLRFHGAACVVFLCRPFADGAIAIIRAPGCWRRSCRRTWYRALRSSTSSRWWSVSVQTNNGCVATAFPLRFRGAGRYPFAIFVFFVSDGCSRLFQQIYATRTARSPARCLSAQAVNAA